MPRSSGGSHVESSTTRCSATVAATAPLPPAELRIPGPRLTDRRARGRVQAASCRDARRPCLRTRLSACDRRTGTGVSDLRLAKPLLGAVAEADGASARDARVAGTARDTGCALSAPGRVTVVRHLGRPRDRERRCAGSSGPASAAGPALSHGNRPTRPRGTGMTPHGPIRLCRTAVPAVAGEEPGQAGNWPDSAVTCLRCSCLRSPWCRSPWCRCGRSCGCRGSCRRRACWSGRRSM